MDSQRAASAAALFLLLACAVLVLSLVSCTATTPLAFGAPCVRVVAAR